MSSLPPVKVIEVAGPESKHLGGMNRWLEQVFPEYCPPRFERLLSRHRHPDGRHGMQIFVGLADGIVAGLAQQFYLEWGGRLLADIDLLGVLEPFRRSGLALELVQRCMEASTEMALQYGIPAAGVASLIDPGYEPIVNLHRKLGGRIRTDWLYPSGDCIVWYPMLMELDDVPTTELGGMFQEFGRMLD